MKTNTNPKPQKKSSARRAVKSSFEGWATNHNTTLVGCYQGKANIEGWATNHCQSMI